MLIQILIFRCRYTNPFVILHSLNLILTGRENGEAIVMTGDFIIPNT